MEDLKAIKSIIRELVAEIAELRRRVEILEALPETEPAGGFQHNPILLGAESYGNMGKIYAEGYHICPAVFGQIRDEGECLFCVNILEVR